MKYLTNINFERSEPAKLWKPTRSRRYESLLGYRERFQRLNAHSRFKLLVLVM